MTKVEIDVRKVLIELQIKGIPTWLTADGVKVLSNLHQDAQKQ